MSKIYTWLKSQPLHFLLVFLLLTALSVPMLLILGYKFFLAPIVALIGIIGQRALVPDEPQKEVREAIAAREAAEVRQEEIRRARRT
jgi:hypothetical protein